MGTFHSRKPGNAWLLAPDPPWKPFPPLTWLSSPIQNLSWSFPRWKFLLRLFAAEEDAFAYRWSKLAHRKTSTVEGILRVALLVAFDRQRSRRATKRRLYSATKLLFHQSTVINRLFLYHLIDMSFTFSPFFRMFFYLQIISTPLLKNKKNKN